MWLKILRGLGLVVLGYLLAIVFQHEVSLQYTHVYQTHDSANQRSLTFNMTPRYTTPVIDLFGTGKDK